METNIQVSISKANPMGKVNIIGRSTNAILSVTLHMDNVVGRVSGSVLLGIDIQATMIMISKRDMASFIGVLETSTKATTKMI